MKQKNYLLKRRGQLGMVNLLLAVTFFLAALVLIIFLASFHPNDPSWFFISTQSLVMHNYGGIVGSYCAAFLMYIFGSAIVLFIPFLFFLSFLLINNYTLIEEWDRIGAFIVFIVVSSACGSLYQCRLLYSRFAPGGMVGRGIVSTLQRYCDDLVIYGLLITLMVASFIIISRLWLTNAIGLLSALCRNKRLHYAIKKTIILMRRTIELIIIKPFVFCCVELKKIIDGTYVEQSGLSIREFEFDSIVHSALNQNNQEADLKPSSNDCDNKSAVMLSADNVDHAQTAQEPLGYQVPPSELFKKYTKQNVEDSRSLLHEQETIAALLEQKLERFGVKGEVVSIKKGPVVTLFEYQPHIDSKLSKIIALEDDLALALQALSIRIIAPIPGTAVVGFEVANKIRSTVLFSTIVQMNEFVYNPGYLPMIIGVDTVGVPVIADLTTMPHLLLAGATGSGKSVALNVMIMSLLCRLKPAEVQLILIDPKRLEFASYVDIPHLIFPIVANPKDAAPILRWVVHTMEERYQILAQHGVRTITDYHRLCADRPELVAMPFMVIIIDELADLMMVAGKEIEESIARISQMARAAGIHMIVATQRPSVDVITGTIKINFPSRISCKVTSKIDSRTIIDCSGADKLLGKGDMLYLDTSAQIRRVHGIFVSDQEIEQITSYLRMQQEVVYQDVTILRDDDEDMISLEDQDLYKQVVEFIRSIDEISISLLQRRFRIGYNRSARIIELLELRGLIMTMHGGKTRKVIHSR